MAANRLRTCDSTVSWYDFTTSLSWSNTCEVAEVLSDIPFISVGILAFGVSGLFLAIKRVSLSAILLFFSALLAFVAAVLDLGQILADGMAMNTIFVTSEHAVRAREVLFALSIGFRFMFYWTYVTERSRKDLSPSAIQGAQKTISSFFQCCDESHNASWVHWGLPGKLVGAGSLIAILVVTTLQIVWRVVPQFRQYSNVYATDVALELLLSFFLLLKLLWNSVTFNSVDRTLAHTSSKYLAPMSGLLVNIAIGVGDLLCFAFTESTVGRLLQAFEVYIIVVFVMVTAFLRHRDALLFTSLQDKRRRGAVTTLPEFPRGSTFRITPPLIETPRMSTIFGTATQNRESILRRSVLSHISPWLSFRVPRRRARQKDEEIKFWDTEKVKASCRTGNTGAKLRVNIDGVATQAYNRQPERMHGASANHVSNTASDTQSPTAWSEEESFIHSDHTLYASRADVLPRMVPPQVRTSSVPVPSAFSSISEMKHVKNTAASSPVASPVYGLGGIQVPASASESRTSLNELLRQQSQLEQTIETLKLFSTETFTSDPSHSNHPRHPELARSLSTGTGQRTICSEAASLSNFPVPPELTTPVPSLPASASLFIKRIRGDRRVRLAAARPTPVQDTDVLVPPKTLASLVDVPGSPCLDSMPHTPTGDNGSLSQEAGKSVYHEPGEVQYNVTSFIGGRTFTNPSDSTSNVAVVEDLATPHRSCQGDQEKPIENRSSSGTIQTCSHMKFAPHGLEDFSCSPVAANLFRSRLPRGDTLAGEPADAMQYRISDRTHCSPMALPQQISGANCGENDVPELPIRHQFARGASFPTSVSAGEIDRAQRVFVRRRPPPLDIQPYTEHKPGTWRVQVLADD